MLADSRPSPTAYRYHVDKGGLPRVLQPHQGQLHLLLPEERLEPVEQLINEGYHLRRLQQTLKDSCGYY